MLIGDQLGADMFGKVWFIEATNEVFTSYEEYLQR